MSFELDRKVAPVMANLVLPKFGPRTISCRKNLALGPLLFCKKWSYLAYFGPTEGLCFAARNGPRTKLKNGPSCYRTKFSSQSCTIKSCLDRQGLYKLLCLFCAALPNLCNCNHTFHTCVQCTLRCNTWYTVLKQTWNYRYNY